MYIRVHPPLAWQVPSTFVLPSVLPSVHHTISRRVVPVVSINPIDWRLQSTNTGVSNQTGRHTYSSQKQCAKYIGIGWFGATGKKQRTSCATCVTALSFFLNGIVEEYEGEWAIARKLWKPCEGPFLCQQAPWLQAPHLESKGPTWPAHGQLLNSQ